MSEPTEADRAAAREWLNGQRLNKTPHMPEVDSLAAFRASAREVGYAAAREKCIEWMDRAIIAENASRDAEAEVARLKIDLASAVAQGQRLSEAGKRYKGECSRLQSIIDRSLEMLKEIE